MHGVCNARSLFQDVNFFFGLGYYLGQHIRLHYQDQSRRGVIVSVRWSSGKVWFSCQILAKTANVLTHLLRCPVGHEEVRYSGLTAAFRTCFANGGDSSTVCGSHVRITQPRIGR